MDEGIHTYEKIEEMINGKMSNITVIANRPSQKAIKRYAEGMLKIIKQIEERESSL